jgi:amidohydrolase
MTKMQIKAASTTDLGALVRKYLPDLKWSETVYKDLHQHPELGQQESRTSEIAANHLECLGFEVHRKLGGYGVTGVLNNGSGRVVLLRADMDALPVREETGLPYASNVTQTNLDGQKVPVMHACGHDMHVTCLMAVATLLRNARKEWSGTLICLFQPDEESGAGAQAMVDSGLYQKVPIPEIILGQHVNSDRSGNIAITSGPFMTAADSFKVTILGQGGHASLPQLCIDPVLISAYVIVRLQSIVSRLIAPADVAVVTCASIHGGEAENVIPDSVELKLNVRTYDPDVRKRILDSLHDIITAECASAGAKKKPLIQPTTQFPLTDNDPRLVDALREEFRAFFGDQRNHAQQTLSASEDVSNLAKPNNTPYAFWFIGGTDPETWDEAERKGELMALPANHSSRFAPVIQPTLETGVQALAIAALRYLT